MLRKPCSIHLDIGRGDDALIITPRIDLEASLGKVGGHESAMFGQSGSPVPGRSDQLDHLLVLVTRVAEHLDDGGDDDTEYDNDGHEPAESGSP